MKHRDPWSTFENGTSITIIDKRKQGLLNLTIVLSSPKLKATVKKLSAEWNEFKKQVAWLPENEELFDAYLTRKVIDIIKTLVMSPTEVDEACEELEKYTNYDGFNYLVKQFKTEQDKYAAYGSAAMVNWENELGESIFTGLRELKDKKICNDEEGDSIIIDSEITKNMSAEVKDYYRAAKAGDAEAQCILGRCYFDGDGVEEDHYKAIQWFKKSAEQGYAIAQYNLGECYFFGEGVEKNRKKAVEWFTKSAEAGDTDAQVMLGGCYVKGWGVARNQKKAVEWYTRAAEKGDSDAQCELGWCYFIGKGVKKDREKAVEWYTRAAEKGNSYAQYELSKCYDRGLGVEKNKRKSSELYEEATGESKSKSRKRSAMAYVFSLLSILFSVSVISMVFALPRITFFDYTGWLLVFFFAFYCLFVVVSLALLFFATKKSKFEKENFVIAAFWVLCFFVSAVVMDSLETFYYLDNNPHYSKNLDGSYTYVLNGESGDFVIPSEYKGKPVTGIMTFENATSLELRSIYIPDTVTSISARTFYECTSLQEITIGKGVTKIGIDAFYGCRGIRKVNVTSLESWCEIENHSSPLYSSWGAKLYLNDVEVTGYVNIPKGTRKIGDYAFYGLTGINTVTIPDSVTSIGDSAFKGCTGMTSITIPNSVQSIDSGTFEDCTSLTSITIPNSVTSIGEGAFSGCSGLTSIKVDPNNKTYRSEGDCLIERKTNKLIAGCKTSVIPNSVTSIGESAFSGCTGLKEITIPNSVTSIDFLAFSNCTGLTSITIPYGVKRIVLDAFVGCSKLTTLIIPNSVESIVTILSGCKELKTLYYEGTSEQWNAISIDTYGIDDDYDFFNEVNCYYFSSQPIYDGEHWHWDEETNNTPEVWVKN